MNKLVQKSTALFLIITLTFTIAGCSVKPGNVKPGAGEGSTGTTAEAALPEDHILGEGSGIKGVDPATWMDSDIQQWVKMTEEVPPTADYNLHVNREWMINTELPDGYASYDSITERAVEVDAQILDILKNPEKETDAALIHDQELVQKYYSMWLDWESRNKLGVQPLKDRLTPLMEVETLEDLTDYLSSPETAISATELLTCDVDINWNDTSHYAVYVAPVDLIFGDSMYYGMMSESDAMAEPYYDQVIRHILVELGYTDSEATSILKGCFAFEQDIAEHIMTTEEESARDAIAKQNNPRTM